MVKLQAVRLVSAAPVAALAPGSLADGIGQSTFLLFAAEPEPRPLIATTGTRLALPGVVTPDRDEGGPMAIDRPASRRALHR